jgi:hypothetical protein
MQGFLTVDGVITGHSGLIITGNGASITGTTLIDGTLTVTGACLTLWRGLAWDAHNPHWRITPTLYWPRLTSSSSFVTRHTQAPQTSNPRWMSAALRDLLRRWA